MPMIR
jgi:hypothetical protein